uniref:Uncharacterized protein n=1 Tax=Romanomermis culicivorax TaxID=13658 RepID=A0A915IN71_ROMCU
MYGFPATGFLFIGLKIISGRIIAAEIGQFFVEKVFDVFKARRGEIPGILVTICLIIIVVQRFIFVYIKSQGRYRNCRSIEPQYVQVSTMRLDAKHPDLDKRSFGISYMGGSSTDLPPRKVSKFGELTIIVQKQEELSTRADLLSLQKEVMKQEHEAKMNLLQKELEAPVAKKLYYEVKMQKSSCIHNVMHSSAQHSLCKTFSTKHRNLSRSYHNKTKDGKERLVLKLYE